MPQAHQSIKYHACEGVVFYLSGPHLHQFPVDKFREAKFMGKHLLAAVIGFTTLLGGFVTDTRAQTRLQQWDFEDDQEGQSPAGFSFSRTGQGRSGQWLIRTALDAPSGRHVLVQVDADATDVRFPMAVAERPVLADVRLSVRCKPELGTVDQACGLVVRYQDEGHYYLTRANALEQNVRFYRVVHGQRQQLATWRGRVASGVWHHLQLEVRGNHFVIFWDSQHVMEAVDETFREPGRVGVWTKADSVTAFDDLTVEPLDLQP